MPSIVCELVRRELSPDDSGRRERFLKCFFEQIDKGPLRDPAEDEQREVDVSAERHEITLHGGDLTPEKAKRSLEKAARGCDPTWFELCEITCGDARGSGR